MQELFQPTYWRARDRFLGASSSVSGLSACHRLDHGAVRDNDLFCDVFQLGPDKAALGILMIAGTHGIEGFTGSAIQVAALESGILSSLAKKAKVVLIHSLNPFGMAYRRRVNEENVDVNRNFVDHSRPYPDNPGYDILAEALLPSSLTTAALTASRQALDNYAAQHGFDALQAAVTQGQYTHPNGLYFGGHKPSWSHCLFTEVIEREFGACERALLIDLHTGLGPRGTLELITDYPIGDPGLLRARDWFGEDVTSTSEGSSACAPLHGTTDRGFELALPGRETTAVVMEFGTLAGEEIFAATQADHWLYAYGTPTSGEGRRIGERLQEVFNPADRRWRETVIEKSLAKLEHLCERL